MLTSHPLLSRRLPNGLSNGHSDDRWAPAKTVQLSSF